MPTTTNTTTTFKDVGNSFLGLLSGVFTGGAAAVQAAGANAKANASGNQAIADANRAAPTLISEQLKMQAEKDKAQRDTIMYAGAGAGALVVIIIIILVVFKKKK